VRLKTPGTVVAVVATAGAQSRCARWVARGGCVGGGGRKAVTADVMGGGNREVSFRITIGIVLKVDVGSAEYWTRQGANGAGIDGLTILLVRIRRISAAWSSRSNRMMRRGWGGCWSSTGGCSEFKSAGSIA